jgi:hypothetical protein
MIRAEKIAAFKKFAGDVIYTIEDVFAIACEAVQRTLLRLDPRLYSQRRRIRAVTEGLARKPSDKAAIFVVYAQGRLPDFTMNFIAALNRHSFNVIIVANSALDADARAALLRNGCLLVERDNFGRDFGGYKDGIAIALQRFPGLRRLIIANDSLYYLQKGLDDLVAALEGPQDFIGISEVFEHHYHVASFLLSFGRAVLDDPVFHRFWARYQPIHTRMWAIMQGEGELTRQLVEAGHRPHVLFRAQSLLPKLQELSGADLRATLALFPTHVRPALAKIVAAPASDATATANGFAAAAVKEVMERNQMHTAGFVFMKFLGLPLIKRDIVYRELFPLQEAIRIVQDFAEPMQDDIAADLALRPPPSRFAVLRRLFYRHGYV